MAEPQYLTYGPGNIDHVLAATRSAIIKSGPEIVDQIFVKIPLLNWLNQKAKVTKQGGASLLARAQFAKNSTVKAYNRYETLDTQPQENFTLMQFKWARYAASVALAGDELAQNGAEQIASIANDKAQNAMGSIREQINLDLFESTANSKKINPLPVLVDQTSTVGDVNSSTNSWWQAQQTASGSMAAQGLADMRQLYNTIGNQGQAGGVPDFGLTTQTLLEAYEGLAEPELRYTNSNLADQGFQNFRFKNMVLTQDPNCNSGVLYMLSSDHMKYCVHSKRDFTMGNFKEPVAQDAKVAQVFFMGQVMVLQRRKLGKLTGMSA